jgi:hypothetical protein
MDQYFTPAEVAQRIIRSLDCKAPGRVADFAAGEGSLLAAVRDRWPESMLYATDLDVGSVRRLRKRFKEIWARTCDFLEQHNHRGQLLHSLRGVLPLILLNPPFSSRGGTKFPVTIGGKQLSCSKALAFVAESVKYLSPDGTLIALLPSSCFTSDRDKEAIEALVERFQLSELRNVSGFLFTGCSVEVRCVSLRPRNQSLRVNGHVVRQFRPKIIVSGVRIFRGRLSMCNVLPSRSLAAAHLVHTTDLRENTVRMSSVRVQEKFKLRGPAVLIPRVGRPNKTKVALYSLRNAAVLSDCIIAIQAATIEETRVIFSRVQSRWSLIEKLYAGSCAKYLTLSKMRLALLQMGISAEIDERKTPRQDYRKRFAE